MRSVDQLRDRLDSVKRWLGKVHDEERACAMSTGGNPAKKAIELTSNMKRLAAHMSLSFESLKARTEDSDHGAVKLETDQEAENGESVDDLMISHDPLNEFKSSPKKESDDCVAVATIPENAIETAAEQPVLKKGKTNWSLLTPAQLQARAPKRRLVFMPNIIESTSRAYLHENDAAMTEAEQNAVLQYLDADDKRSTTRHLIEIANMRRQASCKKFYAAKIKLLREELKQSKQLHELRLSQMQEFHALQMRHADEIHQHRIQLLRLAEIYTRVQRDGHQFE